MVNQLLRYNNADVFHNPCLGYIIRNENILLHLNITKVFDLNMLRTQQANLCAKSCKLSFTSTAHCLKISQTVKSTVSTLLKPKHKQIFK